LINWPW